MQILENGHSVTEETRANVIYSCKFVLNGLIRLYFQPMLISKIYFCRNLKVVHLLRCLGLNWIATSKDPQLSVSMCVLTEIYLPISCFPFFVDYRSSDYNIFVSTLLQENVDALIDCVMKDVGFSQGKPVAAFTIYKCLLHWKSFEAERTSVFDRLIQMIGSAIEVILSNYPKSLLAYL